MRVSGRDNKTSTHKLCRVQQPKYRFKLHASYMCMYVHTEKFAIPFPVTVYSRSLIDISIRVAGGRKNDSKECRYLCPFLLLSYRLDFITEGREIVENI